MKIKVPSNYQGKFILSLKMYTNVYDNLMQKKI